MQHVPRKTPRQYPQRHFHNLYGTYSSPADGDPEHGSPSGPSNGAVARSRPNDVTGPLRKLALKPQAPAPGNGKLNGNIEAILKALKVADFKVRYPLLKLPNLQKVKVAAGSSPPVNLNPAKPKARAAVASAPSPQVYKYYCDCKKGFNQSEGVGGLKEHLRKHTGHKQKRWGHNISIGTKM